MDGGKHQHVLTVLGGYGGIRSTVVVRWTVGQQVGRSILQQGHDSEQNSSHSPRLFPAQYSVTSAELWPKTPFISFLDGCLELPVYAKVFHYPWVYVKSYCL